MAVIGTIGQTVTVTGGFGAGSTYIDKRNPATVNGKLYTVTIQTSGSAGTNTTAIKIFRINGTNYDVLYNQSLSNLVTDSSNTITLTTPVNVLTGDLLGFWTGTAGIQAALGYENGAGTGYHSKVGNITTTTTITDWAAGSETSGLKANIYRIPTGIFTFFM